MCFGGGNNGEDPDAKKSKEIEKQLREDQKKMAKEVKMLLLGTAHLHWTLRVRVAILTDSQVPESLANPRS